MCRLHCKRGHRCVCAPASPFLESDAALLPSLGNFRAGNFRLLDDDLRETLMGGSGGVGSCSASRSLVSSSSACANVGLHTCMHRGTVHEKHMPEGAYVRV